MDIGETIYSHIFSIAFGYFRLTMQFFTFKYRYELTLCERGI